MRYDLEPVMKIEPIPGFKQTRLSIALFVQYWGRGVRIFTDNLPAVYFYLIYGNVTQTNPSSTVG